LIDSTAPHGNEKLFQPSELIAFIRVGARLVQSVELPFGQAARL